MFINRHFLHKLNPYAILAQWICARFASIPAQTKFLAKRQARMTLLSLSGRCDFICFVMLKNKVAFLRGLNFLSRGINKNAKIYIEKLLGRVELSRNQNFYHLTIINHSLLQNYTS